MKNKHIAIQPTQIENRIYLIRGHKIMLDIDLAELYGVETRALIQATKRNIGRFPNDFMFQLTVTEWEVLRSQIVTSKKGRGGRRYLPYVFTEHGAIMLASALNSERAVETSIFVVRAFVHMREMISVNKVFAQKLSELERRVGTHDEEIKALIAAIRQLMQPPQTGKKKIGFNHQSQ
ncbi:MAG: ORF6N domain-containing protein [candidate division Zixibacteria bacterium]|nr:ORF6N domain-containing protein [candidate division Zixibacteria bacterium]